MPYDDILNKLLELEGEWIDYSPTTGWEFAQCFQFADHTDICWGWDKESCGGQICTDDCFQCSCFRYYLRTLQPDFLDTL